MSEAALQAIRSYLKDVASIERSRTHSPLTVPESQAAALKAATKLPADIDEELATELFAQLFFRAGLFPEVKAVREERFALLMSGLKACLRGRSDSWGYLHELELRFALGEADLTKFAKARASLPSRSDFLNAVALIWQCLRYSNFPNMLKKRAALLSLFTPPLVQNAELALLATPYLGIDSSGRDYFVPSDFRLYWLLVMAVQGHRPERLDGLLEDLSKKKLIRNRPEFDETLARIGQRG